MSDQIESTSCPEPPPIPCRPPAYPPWNEDAGFREVYLVEFEDASTRATLRNLSALLVTMHREGSRFHSAASEPFMVRMLRALARDLRHLHGFAHFLGRRAVEDELDRSEVPLSDLARDLTPAIEQIAFRLEEAVSQSLPGQVECGSPPRIH